eukprot:TCONS_00067274-protein
MTDTEEVRDKMWTSLGSKIRRQKETDKIRKIARSKGVSTSQARRERAQTRKAGKDKKQRRNVRKDMGLLSESENEMNIDEPNEEPHEEPNEEPHEKPNEEPHEKPNEEPHEKPNEEPKELDMMIDEEEEVEVSLDTKSLEIGDFVATAYTTKVEFAKVSAPVHGNHVISLTYLSAVDKESPKFIFKKRPPTTSSAAIMVFSRVEVDEMVEEDNKGKVRNYYLVKNIETIEKRFKRFKEKSRNVK